MARDHALHDAIKAQGDASMERDRALENSLREVESNLRDAIKAQAEASMARDHALHDAIKAQGDASKDRDHALDKRLDDLREDLRAGSRTGAPGYGAPPSTSPVIVAER